HVPTYRYRPGGDMNEQLTESTAIFVLDAITGELVWKYDASHSIRNNAIAIGNRALVLIDRQLALFDRTREGKPDETNHPDGELIAFDLTTGDVLWRNNKEIYGTVAAISKEHHAVMMSYQPTSFRLASEVGGRISVFDLSSGEHKWTQAANYRSRPLLNKDTIYAQGGAWDVLTGEKRPFNFARSYGCGILAGSRNLMVYRSATLGYFDLTRNEGNEDYGGIRPGCWINVIPAGGLVFAPDGSAGCSCSYLNQSWIALQSYGLRAPKIEAETFSDPKEVIVKLEPDAGDPQLRYTLDGSSPTDQSPLYKTPIRITESATLRARAFSDNGRPSPPSDREILIDPNLIPLGGERWKADNGEWENNGGVLIQTTNFGAAPKPTLENTPDIERSGALYIFDSEQPFVNGEFSFDIRSEDNDALGFVLGYQDPQSYYLWSISAERPYRVLALKNGDDYRVLGGITSGYAVKKWHKVRIMIKGSNITGFFDGEEDFSVNTEGYRGGKIGFYSWGNTGSFYRNLRFKPAQP
ncbi:MAG: chitobiase/beta-hexosaminidase C-terminal domain-containing protein, partial [Verrucomicrobiota bacterium]